MSNWFWVIPWVVAIIFAAGWYSGSKRTELRMRYQARKEHDDELSRMNHDKHIDDEIDIIHRRLGTIDHYIQRLNDIDKKIFNLENKEGN